MRSPLFLVCVGCAPALAPALPAADEFPDFDLRLDCPGAVTGAAGAAIGFAGVVVLRSSPADPLQTSGARAWSLSIRSRSGARITGATTDGTDGETQRAPDGYTSTQLTRGFENEGVVSAVILSFANDVSLPASGEASLLRLELEVDAPADGDRDHDVSFIDGLMGPGQPVKNTITIGEGITRRDDGGELDNDLDEFEPCLVRVRTAARFRRGDINVDDSVALTDAVVLLEHLFQGGTHLDCSDAADANDDGELNVSDAAFLLQFLFRGGRSPPEPFVECGADVTASRLDCSGDGCK